MSARFLTAYLTSAFLLAGLASQLMAEPPTCCEACKATQPEVVTQVRVINVPHNFAGPLLMAMGVNEHGNDCRDRCPCCPYDWKAQVFLTEQEVGNLLKTIQSNEGSKVLCAPQMRTCSGQCAQICVSEQQYFVTNVVKAQMGGQTVLMPENKAFQPAARWPAGRKSVRMGGSSSSM